MSVINFDLTQPRQWWSAVKRITGQSRQQPLNCLSPDGNMQQLAADINSFFHSVSANLVPLDTSSLPAVEDVSVEQFIIEPYQVERKLALLRAHKACGPDNLPNWFWRDFSVWLAQPLCAIFNVSIRQGIVLQAWKLANVVPVPKTNPPATIDLPPATIDLRPISLTPCLCKVLESFIGQWILDDLQGKIDERQYGALKGKSTTHELVDILHHWHKALENNSTVRIVFIDYAKAFDHVDHSTIIRKLVDLGVSGVLVRHFCPIDTKELKYLIMFLTG